MLTILVLLACGTISQVAANISPKCPGCLDYYGKCRSDGEVWTDDGSWQYQCQVPDAVFTGCFPSTPTKEPSALIAPGEKKILEGFWHTCEITTRKLRYEQEPFCDLNGTLLHIGDTFRDRVFQKSCHNWGIGVDGCFYASEDGSESFLLVGSAASVGLVRHHCTALPRRPSRVQYWTSIPNSPNVITAQGKAHNRNLPPVDMLNFLTSHPVLWRQDHATDFIRNDGSFQIKIRYLD